MNPFFLFQRFAAANIEKSLSEFLVNNRLFQVFAHRSSQKAEETAKKFSEALDKFVKQEADSSVKKLNK